jgi:hypothetical protein
LLCPPARAGEGHVNVKMPPARALDATAGLVANNYVEILFFNKSSSKNDDIEDLFLPHPAAFGFHCAALGFAGEALFA